MPVTYDPKNNIITVTGYTEKNPCTFEDIYQADKNGGWGVVSKQGDKQYLLDCRLRIGDGSTETWFATSQEQITFYTQGRNYRILQVFNKANFRSGVLGSSEKGQGGKGSDFLFVIKENTHTSNQIRFDGGTVKLYCSKFEVFNKARVGTWALCWVYPSHIVEAFQTFWSGFRGMYGAALNGKFVNFTFTAGGSGLEKVAFGPGSEYIWICNNEMYDVTTPPRGELGQPPLTKAYFEKLRIWEPGPAYRGGVKDFLGPYPFPVPKWFIPKEGAMLKWFITVKIKVVEKDGTPIEGALVQLYNKDGELQFQATTNDNGEVLGELWIVKDIWAGEGTDNLRTDFNPLRLRITKVGYTDFETKLTLYKPVDYLIRLTKIVDVVFVDGKIALSLSENDPENEVFKLI